MKLSIVIPTHNNFKILHDCVESILKHTLDYEIIIVANGCTDATVPFFFNLAKFRDNLHVTQSATNLGFSAACNLGAARSDGEFICFLNDDTLVTPHWAERLFNCWENAPQSLGIKRVGIVGPASNFAAGKQSLFTRDIAKDNYIAQSADFTNNNVGRYDLADFVSGFCMFMSMQAWEDVGHFDDDYGLGGFEDNDLCVRMDSLGYRNVIAYDSFVYHLGSTTINKPQFQNLRGGTSNFEIFLKKHHTTKQRRLVTSFSVNSFPPRFKQSVMQALGYSDAVSISLDGVSLPEHLEFLLNEPKCSIFKHPKEDNEMVRRNAAIEAAMKLEPDWILSLDGDECLESKATYAYMHRLISHPNPMVKFIAFPFANFWNSPFTYRIDGIFGQMIGPRLFKVFPDQRLHSNHPEGLHVGHCPGPTEEGTRFAGIKILHWGYLDENVRSNKFEYYSKLDSNPREDLIGSTDYSHLISQDVSLHKYMGSQSISFNMIVYNEFFEAYQLLDQIYTSVDEIIINLTGEEDRFRFTAKAFNAVIDNIPFKNDFSEIRNQMLEKSFGDWILYADPDEAYHPDFLANLQKFVDVACDAYLFTVENLHKNKPSNFTDTIRLFRRKPDMIFRGQVHENLDISLKGNDKKICQMPFNVIHFGYALPWKSEEASELAYSALCKKAVKKHPHDPMANFNFALCLLSVGKPIEAKDYLARAASIDPQYFHPRVQLGLLALKEALFHFGEVNTILPDSHRLKDVVRRVLSTVRPFVENE